MLLAMREIICLLILVVIRFPTNAALNREKLINEAVKQASKESHDETTSRDLLHAFKLASKQAIQQGNARIRFENLIHRAERNILESERLEMKDATNLAKAEEIAKILVSKPGSVLTKAEIAEIYQVEECRKLNSTLNCDEYETIQNETGICNNLANPYLGSAGTPFRRLLLPQYEDSFSSLRGTMQSEKNSLLNGQPGPFQPPNPSPRVISLNVIKDLPNFNNNITHLLMQWGQFVEHDVALAPVFKNVTCGCDITEKCVPIRVPSSDPTFGMQGPTREDICLPFPRTIPACDLEAAEGKLHPREQINAVSSFIDASQVYGSNQDLYDAVKLEGTQCLRTGPPIPENERGVNSLPIDTQNLVECMGATDCFLAGDVRVNEQTSLIVMHTLWMREHNFIANGLLTMNANFDDVDPETVFQTARAIVIAEIQKITFKDYLPVLLGSAMSLIKPYSGYNNSSVDPSVPNAFAAAASLFRHSQINNVFDRLNKSNMPLSIGPLSLLDAFFNSSQYSTSLGTDPLLRGLLQRPARSVDEFVNDILTNQLFKTSTSQGMDLAALNIQRGRDHGLPPYLTWKRWAQKECKISSDFINDLTEVRLLQTYGTLETVDLWVGGLAETHVPGGLLGATFACIFAKTFEALRDGDRFYYENSFSDDQRDSINEISLSGIICENAGDIENIQENAFLAGSSPHNPYVECSSIPALNLEPFGNEINADNWCYLRTKVKRRDKSVTFTTTSTVQFTFFDCQAQDSLLGRSQKKSVHKQFENTLGSEMETICLPFICPTEDNSIKVEVSIDNDQCVPQKNSLLRISEKPQSINGEISNGDINNQNRGVYRGLNACNEGSVNQIMFDCQSNKDEKENLLIDELETLLIQDTATKNSESIRLPNVNFNELPDDLEFIEDNENENDALEQPWRKETINTLENLLSILKAEKNDNKR